MFSLKAGRSSHSKCSFSVVGGAKHQPSSMIGSTVRVGNRKPAETTDGGETLRLTVSSVLQWARRRVGLRRE